MNEITPINREASFDLGELFFSTTDKAGVIQYGNDVFARVSGYPLLQMIGKPHNIVRHPDMPRAVFKLLWDYLLAGKMIVAYVKNMAADGSFYWVVAMAAPIDGGFLSIRLKPSSEVFETVQRLYEEARDIERNAGPGADNRARGLEQSTAHLNESVRRLGFAGYDEFMQHVLLTEMRARRTALGAQGTACQDATGVSGPVAELIASCNQLSREQATISGRLDVLIDLQKVLAERMGFVQELGETLRVMSLNAKVRAGNLRDRGRTLQAVAQQISASAGSIITGSTQVCRSMAEVGSVLRQAAFSIAAADLSIEIMGVFLQQASHDADGTGDTLVRIKQLGEVVNRNVAAACDAFTATLEQLATLERRLAGFTGDVRRLSILHVTGKIEAMRTGDGGSVLSILDAVFRKTEDAREKLSELDQAMERAKIDPPNRRLIDECLTRLAA